MRTAAAAIVLASCAHAPPPVAAPPPPAPTPNVAQLSHAILDAYDRGDIVAVEPKLAPGFVHSEDGEPKDRDKELAQLRKYDPKADHIAERTWSNEHVFVKGTEAVYIGQAAERSNGGRGGRTYDGRYTLAWHWEDGAWKLALWTWQRAGATAEHEVWNDVFKHGTGFEKAPNKLLVATASALTPGAALDIASGQGRNVLYLAQTGWKATGVDFSHEGMEQARAAAKTKNLTVDLVEADVDTTDLGTAKYDLVTMLYAGADPKTIAKAQQALRPGGTFVYEFFAASDDNAHGFHKGDLAKLFGGYDIIRDEIVMAEPDWGGGRDEPLVRFIARKR